MMTEEEDKRRIGIAHLILRLRRIGIIDQRVLGAIESVPRTVFVPAESRAEAYAERALPIDCGQTISAPVIVGMMTAAVDLDERDRVLEMVLAPATRQQSCRTCRRVYTIDRFRTLVSAAESRFRTLRLANITTIVGDGTKGWPEQAPFDRIIVTAASEAMRQALLEQVRVGGVIVAPVGPQDGIQKLLRIERTDAGYETKELADVRFVPLIPGKAERL